MSGLIAKKTPDGKCEWVGPTTGAFLPQLPDNWPSTWPETELDAEEVLRRLRVMWDSEIDAMSLPKLAQRSERIGMQGWFGERVTEGTGPNGRRYSPELYAATFAWVQAEQAYRATDAARKATKAAIIASIVASVIAGAGVVVAVVAIIANTGSGC